MIVNQHVEIYQLHVNAKVVNSFIKLKKFLLKRKIDAAKLRFQKLFMVLHSQMLLSNINDQFQSPRFDDRMVKLNEIIILKVRKILKEQTVVLHVLQIDVLFSMLMSKFDDGRSVVIDWIL